MKPEQINNEVAEQGWALFDIDNTGYLQIQRIDEDEQFEDDAAALAYVAESVNSGLGGEPAAAALAYHYASIAGLEIARENDWKIIHSAQYILEDADPEKLADACGLPLGVIVSALENVGKPSEA